MTNASTTPTPKSGIKTLKMQLQVSQASGVLLCDAMSLLIKVHNCLAAIIRAASDLYKNKQQRLRCKTLKNGLCISRKIRYQIEQAKNKRLQKAPKVLQTHKNASFV